MGNARNATPEPETAPSALVLGAIAAETHAPKGERVFADALIVDADGKPTGVVVPRVTCADGRIGAVQQEVRADGTRGPWMLSLLRIADGRESGTRFSLADVQAVSDAYAAAGHVLVSPTKVGA